MAASPYVIEYAGSFTFPRPPEEVWSSMQHVDRFERWWTWLKDFHVDGAGLETGAVLHGVVVPPLPYRLRVRIALVQCVRPHRIEAAIHGDLEGAAHIDLEPERDGTRARVSSSVEVMQRPLRVAARLAPWVVRWGHDCVVEATVSSFRRHLGEAGDG